MFDVCDPTFEVRFEIGVTGSVLARRPGTRTVVEDGLEFVVVPARHVDFGIQDEPGRPLRNGRTHDPCLAMIHFETFLQNDGADLNLQSFDLPRHGIVAGEDQVVGVTGVFGAHGLSQSRQPTIETKRCEIGQRGRSWSALRQVRTGIERMSPSLDSGVSAARWPVAV